MKNENANRAKTFSFKSAKELLDLMIHSFTPTEYSWRAYFHASDAIDKRRFMGLSDDALALESSDYGIQLLAGQEPRTLRISDNGVGMSRDEMVTNLGTIARSGTRQFTAEMEKSTTDGDAASLIGQFGVGFYSAFMIAENIEVLSQNR